MRLILACVIGFMSGLAQAAPPVLCNDESVDRLPIGTGIVIPVGVAHKWRTHYSRAENRFISRYAPYFEVDPSFQNKIEWSNGDVTDVTCTGEKSEVRDLEPATWVLYSKQGTPTTTYEPGGVRHTSLQLSFVSESGRKLMLSCSTFLHWKDGTRFVPGQISPDLTVGQFQALSTSRLQVRTAAAGDFGGGAQCENLEVERALKAYRDQASEAPVAARSRAAAEDGSTSKTVTRSPGGSSAQAPRPANGARQL